MRKTKQVKWSADMAYIVGLMTTDGNLSKDGRHLDFTSKDLEQLNNFNKCLGTNYNITWKSSSAGKRYPRIQFGDVAFYRWLESIGLTPNKTKTIGALDIPRKHFCDFLRGHFDGDGCIYSYWDKRWKSSYMFYTTFLSASYKHIVWLQSMIENILLVEGKIGKGRKVYRLRFAKRESKVVLSAMYSDNRACLSRKKEKVFKILKQAAVEKLVNSQP